MLSVGCGLSDKTIKFSLCPGGKERLRRLLEVIRTGRAPVAQLVTHKFPFSQIALAYEVFSQQLDGVLKVALYPDQFFNESF